MFGQQYQKHCHSSSRLLLEWCWKQAPLLPEQQPDEYAECLGWTYYFVQLTQRASGWFVCLLFCQVLDCATSCFDDGKQKQTPKITCKNNWQHDLEGFYMNWLWFWNERRMRDVNASQVQRNERWTINVKKPHITYMFSLAYVSFSNHCSIGGLAIIINYFSP